MHANPASDGGVFFIVRARPLPVGAPARKMGKMANNPSGVVILTPLLEIHCINIAELAWLGAIFAISRPHDLPILGAHTNKVVCADTPKGGVREDQRPQPDPAAVAGPGDRRGPQENRSRGYRRATRQGRCYRTNPLPLLAPPACRPGRPAPRPSVKGIRI